ncbi:hypothetical protein BD311DRAFT_869870 [Dichomitus squalens]|uniref:Uncharacterized protein n=1 Tax=Dichomitus squalens TaxID=114155 RepID=A0A4Q9M3V5_9APHY|nr:hypothetical protein BD311DRAFT_869870 [Dichomitus squalens]
MAPWPWQSAGIYSPHYPPNFLFNGVRPSVPQQSIIQPTPVIDPVPIPEDCVPRYPLSVLSQAPDLHPVVERLLLAIPRLQVSSRWSPKHNPFRPFAKAGVDLRAPELRAALDEPAVPEWRTVFGARAPRRHVFPSIRVVFSALKECDALVVEIRVTRERGGAGVVSGVPCRLVENEPVTVQDFLHGLWRGLTENLRLESDEGRGIPSGWTLKAVRNTNRQSPGKGPANSSLGEAPASHFRFRSRHNYGIPLGVPPQRRPSEPKSTRAIHTLPDIYTVWSASSSLAPSFHNLRIHAPQPRAPDQPLNDWSAYYDVGGSPVLGQQLRSNHTGYSLVPHPQISLPDYTVVRALGKVGQPKGPGMHAQFSLYHLLISPFPWDMGDDPRNVSDLTDPAFGWRQPAVKPGPGASDHETLDGLTVVWKAISVYFEGLENFDTSWEERSAGRTLDPDHHHLQ